MLVLGLTGSIGMGKSTVASFFAEAGVPVHDADAAVHRLYEGEAVPAIEAAFPGSTSDGKVDRQKLGAQVLGDAQAIARLEAIVHPLVRRAEQQFLAAAAASGVKVALLDIPLLFETGAADRVDAVVVVPAPEDLQRRCVLERSGMDETKFAAIAAQQLPDSEKRRRADFVVDTSGNFDSTRAQVRAILDSVSTLPRRRR